MALTRSTARRRLVLLEPDDSGELQMVLVSAEVALARCRRCKTRRRVLPCDALPYKTYSLDVIEHEVSIYSRGDQSLRRVAWRQLGEPTPTHTTLHGWTEGLGAHALGRPGGMLGGAPLSRLIAEAKPRLPAVAAVLREPRSPDPRRYRSDPRRDRLVAVLLVMALVITVTSKGHPHAMAACRRLMLTWTSLSALEFRSRLSSTSFEHRDRSEAARSRSPAPRSRDRCPTRTRSPPNASS